jgi:hypothetical protein
MQKATIVVVNITPGGSGFGHRTDNGDSVFIPVSVMKGAQVAELGTYQAKLIPNQYRADVPHMAVRLDPADDEAIASGLPAFISNQTPRSIHV